MTTFPVSWREVWACEQYFCLSLGTCRTPEDTISLEIAYSWGSLESLAFRFSHAHFLWKWVNYSFGFLSTTGSRKVWFARKLWIPISVFVQLGGCRSSGMPCDFKSLMDLRFVAFQFPCFLFVRMAWWLPKALPCQIESKMSHVALVQVAQNTH